MKLKKPKFWDYKKPNFIAYLLLPFTLPLIINNILLKIKSNVIDNKKIKKICIGNIYVGGTGKTPLTIKIYEILKNLNFKAATIKKFYEDQIDEQKILTDKTRLYCKKNRNNALNNALIDDIDVVIFDDGLQDRSINYDLEFVCFNNIKFIGNGFLIPAGPLREKIESIKKYDAIFINGSEIDNSKLKLLIRKYSKDIKVFESYYKPTNIEEFNTTEKYIIFSGIGNPESFRDTLVRSKLNVIEEVIFPDHHNYTQIEINKIKNKAIRLNAKIITTEKDYTKIDSIGNDNIKFLKIELKIKDEQNLINYLKLKI